MQNETSDTVAAVASKMTYTGAGIAGVGWLGVNELVAIGGFVLALIGFGINWYYRARANRREEERHAAEMARLRGDLDEYGA